MDVRSTLYGSRVRIVALVLSLVLVVVVGTAFATGVLGAPSVTDVENRFGGVNETTTVVESDLVVSNPNPFGASFGDLSVDYAVDMNGIRMAEGTRTGVSVSRSTSTLPFTTHMANERIPVWWVSHVRNDEQTTLAVSADIHSSTAGRAFDAPQVTRSVDTDLLSQFNSSEPQPVNGSAPVVSDPVLYINQTNATWGEVTNETTELNIRFVVYNPKSYPIGTTEVGYDIGMNGVTLGEGATDKSVVIPAGETRTIETTTRIRNENLDDWWVTHIERNQVSQLRIDFSARFDLRATTVTVPLTSLDYTKTVETDIFGTKPETGASDTSQSSSEGDESSSSTPAATTTATPTEAPTATPTPTPTPTADGGLLGGSDDSDETTSSPSDSSATPAPTPTPTATPTPTLKPTTTDDGGLLGSYRAAIR
jgi:LEA14-like dessication related protein